MLEETLEEFIRYIKDNLVKVTSEWRYEKSDAQVRCHHLPNGTLKFHNASAHILNNVQAKLSSEETTLSIFMIILFHGTRPYFYY